MYLVIKCNSRVTDDGYFRDLRERKSLGACVIWEWFLIKVTLNVGRQGGVEWWMVSQRTCAAFHILHSATLTKSLSHANHCPRVLGPTYWEKVDSIMLVVYLCPGGSFKLQRPPWKYPSKSLLPQHPASTSSPFVCWWWLWVLQIILIWILVLFISRLWGLGLDNQLLQTHL
jgi:hypothetical protein